MQIPDIAELEAAILARGWVVHREPGRLNIVILRAVPGTLDAFDDMLCVFWTESASLARKLFACRCTADPGKPAREHPKRRDGTAVLAVMQAVDGYALGEHHPGTPGAYLCFRPVRPMPVLRYTSVNDPTGTPSTSDQVQIHRANAERESTTVGAWSDACCVVANPLDYDKLISLGRAAVKAGWPRYTVSLLEQL